MSANHQAKSRSRSMRDISKQSGRIADNVQELGRVAVATAGQAVANLREQGEDVIEDGVKRAKKAKVQFDDLIAGHPIKSLLIALGVGAVLGFALRRRS